MDFALAQLALVFLPGIIWANVDARFGAEVNPRPTTFLVRAFMFGMSTYVVLFLLYEIFGVEFGYPDLASNLDGINFFEIKDEIAWSIPVSLILSVCWLWIVQIRLVMKFLQAIGATRRHGAREVWRYALNSDESDVEFVQIRDKERGVTFAGWVHAYSESDGVREVLLSDAIVYDDEGWEISRSQALYLSRPKDDIWVEFPHQTGGNSNVY